METNKYLEQAKKDLAYLSGEESFKALVDARANFLRDVELGMVDAREDGKAEGIIQGKIEGKVEGKEEEKKEIAKKLLELEIPIDDIIKATGLNKEEIEQL